MRDKILNEVEPSVELARQWGYDELLLFIEQDEDLILMHTAYVPVLMELAADPACPKADYAIAGALLLAYDLFPSYALPPQSFRGCGFSQTGGVVRGLLEYRSFEQAKLDFAYIDPHNGYWQIIHGEPLE